MGTQSTCDKCGMLKALYVCCPYEDCPGKAEARAEADRSRQRAADQEAEERMSNMSGPDQEPES